MSTKVTTDAVLRAAKDARQMLCRVQVRTGVRSEESVFLIPADMARRAVVRHRTKAF